MTHSGFREPKMAKSRKLALGGKKNSSAGFALFLVKSWPKVLEMAPNMKPMLLVLLDYLVVLVHISYWYLTSHQKREVKGKLLSLTVSSTTNAVVLASERCLLSKNFVILVECKNCGIVRSLH